MDELEMDGFTVRTVAAHPELQGTISDLIESVWPWFVLESDPPHSYDLPMQNWYGIYRRWPELQFVLLDGDTVVAAGNALAVAWHGAAADLPDTGWHWAMIQGELDHAAGRTPRTLCALSVTVDRAHQGRRLSRTVLKTMHRLAQDAGLSRMVAPVRPTWKSRYPLTPMAEYAVWTGDQGLPFDPWMRVHARVGARVVKACNRSMAMAGRVGEWERWLDMRFPASGDYVGPGLLSTLHIDRERDEGVYIEPNVWMEHDIA